jgi:ABC-2 type transport system ATP-binding protein
MTRETSQIPNKEGHEMKPLEFNDIHRAYRRGVDVLKGVTFSVGRGEVVGLLGRNGAGKTTLMRIAMGMIETQQGSVSVLGMDPRHKPLDVKRRVGYVSEEQILPSFLSVSQIIDLHRQLFPTWDGVMADDMVRNFGLPLARKIGNLSKGQARQVALLGAVCHKPEVLLLDEPAGGLDPVARREFLETAINLLNEAGSTILFSSHYMSDVERLAERVVLIHGGRVLVDKSLDDLREGHSVVLVPYVSSVTREDLVAMDGCLGARERSDAIHAVFDLEPAGCGSLLRRRLGITDAKCRTVALEEMFVELVGGQL